MSKPQIVFSVAAHVSGAVFDANGVQLFHRSYEDDGEHEREEWCAELARLLNLGRAADRSEPGEDDA